MRERRIQSQNERHNTFQNRNKVVMEVSEYSQLKLTDEQTNRTEQKSNSQCRRISQKSPTTYIKGNV